ncbi:acyl-CoA thioester hydrolase [Sinosporangium album]|uniref:Acyl-CoA thioester hydrolase n=1 Tax=Sinosporangium album TaxID=504805 RepID=A0A1G7T720_9ACTN|nr:thioesterase family protein [Sinosporangium album]SDG30872.1 acyl-CoA thioester hydrolase [Sinosporangium album]
MTDSAPQAAPLPGDGAGSRRHVFHRQVRFADIDSLGHVNNVRFFDYLEDARMALLYVDPAREGGQPYRGFVVLNHEIHYRRPLTLRADPIRVETRVSGIAFARFTLHHEIRDDSEVFAQAQTVLVSYDVEAARPRRLSGEEIAYLKRFA